MPALVWCWWCCPGGRGPGGGGGAVNGREEQGEQRPVLFSLVGRTGRDLFLFDLLRGRVPEDSCCAVLEGRRILPLGPSLSLGSRGDPPFLKGWSGGGPLRPLGDTGSSLFQFSFSIIVE